MKVHSWVTIAAASAVWGPACVLAQVAQGGIPIPQSSENRPATSGGALSDIDRGLPNRRIPSVTPPQSGSDHPITPDEAWPKSQPSAKQVRPFPKANTENDATDEDFSGTGELDTEEPLEGIRGVEGPIEQ